MGSGKTFGCLVKGLLHLGVKKKEVGGGGLEANVGRKL